MSPPVDGAGIAQAAESAGASATKLVTGAGMVAARDMAGAAMMFSVRTVGAGILKAAVSPVTTELVSDGVGIDHSAPSGTASWDTEVVGAGIDPVIVIAGTEMTADPMITGVGIDQVPVRDPVSMAVASEGAGMIALTDKAGASSVVTTVGATSSVDVSRATTERVEIVAGGGMVVAMESAGLSRVVIKLGGEIAAVSSIAGANTLSDL
jgi:hypothetical protein